MFQDKQIAKMNQQNIFNYVSFDLLNNFSATRKDHRIALTESVFIARILSKFQDYLILIIKY